MTVCLFDLFVPYEPRKCILQHLSAWDVAKLDVFLGRVLDEQEREVYINPIRDLFYHVSKLNALLEEGMKLVFLGDDVARLKERLKYPERYAKGKHASRKLQIYLLGMFPVQLRNGHVLDKMLHFCAWGSPHPDRVNYDKASFVVIKSGRSNTVFMMSFGVSILGGRIEDRGFWYSAPETPDSSVSLRVYVPCFRDRMLGEAIVRPPELSGILGCTLNFRSLRAAWAFLSECRRGAKGVAEGCRADAVVGQVSVYGNSYGGLRMCVSQRNSSFVSL
jgi:hypothetical protein